MNQDYDCDIRLNKFGQPDVDYYISEAKRLRALAISQLIQEFAEWLKVNLGKHHEIPLRPSV